MLKAKLKNLKLTTKFSFLVIVILLAFSSVFSLIIYKQLKNRAIEAANENTLIIMTQINAVGSYVRNTLRPKMYQLMQHLNQEDFFVEAMSTTHVSQEVMRLFNAELKDYVYNRVSDRPINKNNIAQDFQLELLNYFRANPEEIAFNGTVNVRGNDVILRAKPIRASHSCMQCHSNEHVAPKGLLKRYPDAQFWRHDESIVGVDIVYVPIDVTISQIKGFAIATYALALTSVFFLFMSLQGAFWSLVSRPLNNLAVLFKAIAKGAEPLNQALPVERHDEIGELTEAFNQLAHHLYEAQKSLQNSAETLRSIFEGITDPVALVNPDCSLEMTNQAYREWITKGISAVFTKKCDPDVCDADTMCPVCYLAKVKKEKKPVSEYWESEDGKYYYIHLYPIFDENGNVYKAVHYVKDITDKMKMHEQMRIAEKMAAVGQLSAGVAHEINNPLGGIRLCFNNLIKTDMDEKTRQEHIELINSALERIQKTVKQLLDFSKTSSLTVSSVNINSVLENVFKLADYYLNKREIELIKDFEPDLPSIMADADKLQQVFLNLLLNAIHAMKDTGGTLTVRTGLQNQHIVIVFEDTGHGISERDLPYIFDPFFTTKGVGEGTGLGLSVSKSIIEQHHGRIDVKSSPAGTVFTIHIPTKPI